MQADFARQLRRAVSNERLEGYVARGAVAGDDNLFSHYAWNIALAESLYPSLQCLEVALRNSMHMAISQRCGRQDWYDTVLKGSDEQAKLNKAKANLISRQTPLDPGKVVAELTFGFWACLLDSRYETFWPPMLKSAFPSVPNFCRTRKYLSKEVNEIRTLRNRAFHHEPIWHWQDLTIKHSRIINLIGGINPAMKTYVEAIDRFPSIHAAGVTKYQNLVQQMGNPQDTVP